MTSKPNGDGAVQLSHLDKVQGGTVCHAVGDKPATPGLPATAPG